MSGKDTVFLVVPSLSIGGQERQALLTEKCLREEYNVRLIVFQQAENGYQTSVPVVNLDLPAKNGRINKVLQQLRRASALKKLRKREKPIAVYSFGDTANLTNVLSRGWGKTVVSYRGYDSTHKSTLNQIICAKADRIVTISGDLQRVLARNYPKCEHKILTVYNGSDLERSVVQSAIPIMEELPHPLVACLGRVEEVKGYRHLLRAFVQVIHKIPAAKLMFIGDGSLKPVLMELSGDLEVENNVIWMGFQSNPFQYLVHADLFVMPSIHEGFGNAIVEAMVCGVPVIAADCQSGPREILAGEYSEQPVQVVVEADFGILVPPFVSHFSHEPEKEELLAEAILRMLSDDELRKHYAQKGKERAKAFSVDTYREHVIEIIESGCEK